jgi:pimeloyl-ACP methyl ester carboxylesterase
MRGYTAVATAVVPAQLHIEILGGVRVMAGGREVPLPASRKTRALLGFLALTGRPHRRERLCELIWNLPDDPKAALRWSLSKLRRVLDAPDRLRIVADRERVSLDLEGVGSDLDGLRDLDASECAELTCGEIARRARRLQAVLLDGLDGVGDDAFDAWLAAERAELETVRLRLVRVLVGHPSLPAPERARWLREWQAIDPEGARAAEGAAWPPKEENAPGARAASVPMPGQALRTQRIGFCQAADGAKIAYATLGSGPPLLKAANWLTHLEFDWATPIWGRSFAEIAAARTFVRYDERGCGLSDWDVADLSFDAFVEDLEIVADMLGLKRFPLLGISQGAAVSIEYAARHPERVSGLILLGGYAAGWRHLASPEEKARREAVRTLTEVGWGTDNPAYRHIFSQTFMPGASADDLAWFDDFQRLTTSPRNAARFQDAFGDIDVRDRLADVRVPTIVMHSRQDVRIPVEQGRALARGIPGARFVPLESRNHVLVDYEPAWRTCVAAMTDFLFENRI